MDPFVIRVPKKEPHLDENVIIGHNHGTKRKANALDIVEASSMDVYTCAYDQCPRSQILNGFLDISSWNLHHLTCEYDIDEKKTTIPHKMEDDGTLNSIVFGRSSHKHHSSEYDISRGGRANLGVQERATCDGDRAFSCSFGRVMQQNASTITSNMPISDSFGPTSLSGHQAKVVPKVQIGDNFLDQATLINSTQGYQKSMPNDRGSQHSSMYTSRINNSINFNTNGVYVDDASVVRQGELLRRRLKDESVWYFGA